MGTRYQNATPFGVLARRARTRLGLSQRQVAELIGLKREQVSRIETGARKPGFGTALKMASTLRIDLSELTEKGG